MLQLKKFTFNPFLENTYIIWDDTTRETSIIDPGCYGETEEYKLLSFIKENNLSTKYIINTHCHIDHVLGNQLVKDKFRCDFYAPELDIPLLQNVTDQAKMFGIEIEPSPLPDHYITEDLELTLGESVMKFIFTPGHTPGEYCILFKNESICISGDVLFNEGIGRTDLWGGDYNTILKSIREKLFTLDDEINVYPGHGDETTIGHEKVHNPFLM